MTLQQITASDIARWDSLQDIANSFEKRGLKPRPNLGDDNELVLQLADDEFVTIVEAGPGESATDFKPQNRTRHTNFVATNDFEDFTFITRVRSWEGQQHGRIKHQKLSFTKQQFQSESGEKNTILQKLNSIEYGSSAAIYDTLYDTQQIVKEFYQQFESLRTDLVQEVAGIPDDRGDAKQRYVQVLLDRMIFLYFIQEKRLLDRNPEYLHEKPDEILDDEEDRYENFYAPLFFEYLAEDQQNPKFGKLPYLNGGLFAKTPVEEEFEDAKLGGTPKETNELFDDILDFLSDWNWNVDERLDIVDPKNLSPAVLGHIFEQTVNQKEMGAYYTPEEITGFMARRTVHPYLLDQLNEIAGTNYDEVDDVFGFSDVEASAESAALADGGMVTHQAPTENVDVGHVEMLYHDILKEAKLLDPAVGSGAFLLAGQEVLLDLYMQCIELFQHLEDEGKGWELSSRTRDELETITSGKENASLYAKRTIILNNLYGVDIDDGAVEICKLRLWLSMVADIEDEPGEVEPLPNIDFNIRQGNSLIGFTDLEEVATNAGDASLSNYGGGVGRGVREMYEDVIQEVERHRSAKSAKEAANARRLAESHIDRYSEELNGKIHDKFKDADIADLSDDELNEYSPFHWVLEFATVYQSGGFDLVVGNPPWDVITVSRDDFFVKYDSAFRTKTPDEKDEIQSNLLENEEVKQEWESYQSKVKQEADYFNSTDDYQLQKPVVAGQTSPNQNDLSALFLERVFRVGGEGAYVSLILPENIFNGSATKDLRTHLIEETEIESIISFENKGIFDQIDDRYGFGIVTFQNGGSTDVLHGIFDQHNLDILRDTDFPEIPADVLKNYSPEARIFPSITEQEEVDILNKIISYPPLGNNIPNSWNATAHRELILGYDAERLIESSTPAGDYPVYGGSNIYQMIYDNGVLSDISSPEYWSISESKPEESAKYRVREKAFNRGDLKDAIYQQFGGSKTSKSKKGFVNDLLAEYRGEPLSEEDILPDYTEYRIVFRDVTNSTNERTVIATVLPKGIVCLDSIRTIPPYQIDVSEEDLSDTPLHNAYERTFTDRELFTAVGLFNSIPFDYLLKTKVSTHIPKYKFEESQVPRLTEGDDWFNYISTRAARLNCYGDEFTEMRERLGGVDAVTDISTRKEIQTEIDAAAFHAYGFNKDESEYIIENFNRVSSPRLMTEDYFNMVSEKYTTLEDEGPHP